MKTNQIAMFKKGDRVTVLDEAVNGLVVNVEGNNITIETEEGFEIVYRQKELVKIEAGDPMYFGLGNRNLSEILKEKEIPKARSFVKEKKVKDERATPEFDLHIEKLVKNFRGMTNYDILTLQTETAKRHIDFAIKNRIPKIVFIHGVGEGVLKAELDFLLGRYDEIAFQDADYQKYGLGATAVFIKQNASRS